MSTDTPEAGTSAGTSAANGRRAQVVPLLAAGLSVRAIAAQTGISASAVFRIKQASRQKAPATETSASHVTERAIDDGVPDGCRRLTIIVSESDIAVAARRGFLDPGKHEGMVVSALFATCFTDNALRWLSRRGYLNWRNRGTAEAVIAGVNELIARLPP